MLSVMVIPRYFGSMFVVNLLVAVIVCGSAMLCPGFCFAVLIVISCLANMLIRKIGLVALL